jgi:hypothetical protein
MPVTMAKSELAFDGEVGLGRDDKRGHRFSQVLDILLRAKRVRRAGMVDGHLHQGRQAMARPRRAASFNGPTFQDAIGQSCHGQG